MPITHHYALGTNTSQENLTEWATLYIADANLHPEVYTYLTYGPFPSAEEYISFYNKASKSNPNEVLLAIILKPGSVITHKPPTPHSSDNHDEAPTIHKITKETFAGMAGLIAQPTNLIADLGQLLMTPYHRTWVGTETNALLLHHLLDPPSQVGSNKERGGLGLRRVQWQCNSLNTASINAALRLGFKMEGVMKWAGVLPWGKAGDEGVKRLPTPRQTHVDEKEVQNGPGPEAEVQGDGQDELECSNISELERKSLLPQGWDGAKRGEYGPGRHTAMLAICWDDWLLGGVRERVDALVGR